MKIGHRGAASPAVLDGGLAVVEAFLLRAVVIRREGEPRTLAGIDDRVVDRVVRFREHRRERSVAAAILVGAALPAFLAAEIGEDLRVGPALQPGGGPAVVIEAMAAHISETVDRGRAADHLAAIDRDPPVCGAGFGLGGIHPVLAPVQHVSAPGQGDMKPEILVPIAGLEHQNPDGGILGQAVGEGAAGRAGADDDVIEAVVLGHRGAPPLILYNL